MNSVWVALSAASASQDKLCVSYGVLWNAFKRIASDEEGMLKMSREEKAEIFHDTALRVYKLQLPPAAAVVEPTDGKL